MLAAVSNEGSGLAYCFRIEEPRSVVSATQRALSFSSQTRAHAPTRAARPSSVHPRVRLDWVAAGRAGGRDQARGAPTGGRHCERGRGGLALQRQMVRHAHAHVRRSSARKRCILSLGSCRFDVHAGECVVLPPKHRPFYLSFRSRVRLSVRREELFPFIFQGCGSDSVEVRVSCVTLLGQLMVPYASSRTRAV